MVNDPCKLIFGVFTNQITTYNNINLIYAGGIVVVKKNNDFNLGCKKISKDSKSIKLILYVY